MKMLMGKKEFGLAIEKLALSVIQAHSDHSRTAIVGIHTRGVPLARRLVKTIRDKGHPVLEGILDINLYRDDLSEISDQPVIKETNIEFDVNGKVVYLVDDVLYTGRTIRAAMDCLFDLGRPQAVHLIVLVKRRGRELPIDTDYFSLDVKTTNHDNVKVSFVETDGEDEVVLIENTDKGL